MNLPNRLTLIRIFIVPLIILLYLFPYHSFSIYLPTFTILNINLPLINIIVLVLFWIASITDFFDGHIARKRNLITNFGKFADPIADKMLIDSLLIMLAGNKVIAVLPVVVMILRDIVVDGCRMVANGKGIVIAANFLGKLKTVLQIVTISIILLNNIPFEFIGLPMADILLWFTMFVSVLGGINYFNSVRYIIFENI